MAESKEEILLKTYEPVLRFSAGERFFPMKVENFLCACELCGPPTEYSKKTQKILKEGNVTTEDMGEKYSAESYYLKYVIRNPSAFRWLLAAAIVLLVAIIAIIIFVLNVRYRIVWPLSRECWASVPIITPWEWIKIGILGISISFWPFRQTNRKIYAAIVINLFAVFFFGTAYAVGAGLLALAIVLSFLAVFGIYWLYQKLPFYKGKFPETLLLLISFFLLITIAASLGSLIDMSVNFIIAIITFYALSLLSKTLQGESETKTPAYWNERVRNQFLILLIMLFIIFVLFLWGNNLKENFQILFIVGIISSVSLLWFSLDPVNPLRNGILIDEESRDKTLSWNGRILFLIFCAIGIYTCASFLMVYFQLCEFPLQTRLLESISIFVNIFVTLLIFENQIAGFFLDLMSNQLDSNADIAAEKYKKISNDEPGYCYYGRVKEEKGWIVLQYHYFYAFNEWRRMAGGMNNHEGDWEMVSVFIDTKDSEKECKCGITSIPHYYPVGVAYSQHHHGEFRFWHDVHKAQLDNGESAHNPLVYVALGSHANYPAPNVYPPSAQFQGIVRRFFIGLETFFQQFKDRSWEIEKIEKEVQNAADLPNLIAREEEDEAKSKKVSKVLEQQLSAVVKDISILIEEPKFLIEQMTLLQ